MDFPTVYIVYRRRIVLDVTAETTRDCALFDGIINGLTRFSVFVNVIDREELVAFIRVQKAPASAVAVVDGSVTALNPLFVT